MHFHVQPYGAMIQEPRHGATSWRLFLALLGERGAVLGAGLDPEMRD